MKVLSKTAEELFQSLHDPNSKDPLSCLDIVSVYCLRSIEVNRYTQCLAEPCYIEAIKKAKEIDLRIQNRRKGLDQSQPGLLEGIPISIKEEFEQKGFDATCGLAARCFRPCPETGLLISLLIKEGAIPFARTNVPQMLLLPESMNAIWGRTTNPWNQERTSGGSSGGEAALLSAGGSILGIGTDIGGSVRIPALFCGLYSFKPTPQRLTLEGMSEPAWNSENGNTQIRPSAGPMGHCVADLERVMRAWCQDDQMSKADPTVPYVGWKTQPQKSLKIGYYLSDGFFTPNSACSRAVNVAVNSLKYSHYHELVEWKPPSVELGVETYYSIMSADNCTSLLKGLEGEALATAYVNLVRMTKIPRPIQLFLSWLLPKVGQARAGKFLEWCRGRTVEELMQVHIQQINVTKAWIDKMKADNLDCIICPGTGLPALLHDSSADLTSSLSYTFLFNVLHFPVGVVPITTVGPKETIYEDGINDMFTSKAKQVCHNSQGCPVGIQVVGLPFQDEKVLSVMKDLEKSLLQPITRPKLYTEIKIGSETNHESI